jgi:MFS family permease
MGISHNRRMGAESPTRSAGDAVQTLRSDDRRRWIALVALCASFLMIILDQTIVNVALPSIQSDLHFSQSNLAWVVNAYLIAFGGLLMLVGRLGDLIGAAGSSSLGWRCSRPRRCCAGSRRAKDC